MRRPRISPAVTHPRAQTADRISMLEYPEDLAAIIIQANRADPEINRTSWTASIPSPALLVANRSTREALYCGPEAATPRARPTHCNTNPRTAATQRMPVSLAEPGELSLRI